MTGTHDNDHTMPKPVADLRRALDQAVDEQREAAMLHAVEARLFGPRAHTPPDSPTTPRTKVDDHHEPVHTVNVEEAVMASSHVRLDALGRSKPTRVVRRVLAVLCLLSVPAAFLILVTTGVREIPLWGAALGLLAAAAVTGTCTIVLFDMRTIPAEKDPPSVVIKGHVGEDHVDVSQHRAVAASDDKHYPPRRRRR